MAPSLQRTLCWLSGAVTEGQQPGPLFRSNPEECWGPSTTEREMEVEDTDGGQESRRGPRQQQGGCNEFTDVIQVTQWPNSTPGHVA